MIHKRIKPRKDGKSSARRSLEYGEGLKPDPETGELLDKSHLTRFSNFDLVDDQTLENADMETRQRLIQLAAIEMQANCDLGKCRESNKIAHFLFSFKDQRPANEQLADIEDSMMDAVGLGKNHRASFLHNDNGHWHLHVFASRISKDPSHLTADLFQDQRKRDFVAREMELKHGLSRDNGIYYITPDGDIKLDPNRNRNEKPPQPGDRAQSMEKHAGLISFQGWAFESGLAARLKAAKSWEELHQVAGEFDCQIAQRGAGFVIVNRQDEKQLAKLSQFGVTGLSKRLGEYQPASTVTPAKTTYSPTPIIREKGERLPAGRATHEQFRQFDKARDDFKELKRQRLASHAKYVQAARAEYRAHFKALRQQVSNDRSLSRAEKEAARSDLAMQLVQREIAAREEFRAKKAQVYAELDVLNPGRTFRDYLQKQAAQGDELALDTVRRYAAAEDTKVNREREEKRRPAFGAVTVEPENRILFRHAVMDYKKLVYRNGAVDYDLGAGRLLTDTAEGCIKFNAPAARDTEAVETGLMLAQKRFGPSLTLTGDPDFQRFAVETAVAKGIRVTFTDPALEAYRQRLEAEKQAGMQQGRERIQRRELGDDGLPLRPVTMATPDQDKPAARDVAKPAEPPKPAEQPAQEQPTPAKPEEPKREPEPTPAPLEIEPRPDALQFIDRRNELREKGHIIEVPHRLATVEDLREPVTFAELRMTDTADQVAVFELRDAKDQAREKIVLPVDRDTADRLKSHKRGSQIKVDLEKGQDGRARVNVPQGQSRGRKR